MSEGLLKVPNNFRHHKGFYYVQVFVCLCVVETCHLHSRLCIYWKYKNSIESVKLYTLAVRNDVLYSYRFFLVGAVLVIIATLMYAKFVPDPEALDKLKTDDSAVV